MAITVQLEVHKDEKIKVLSIKINYCNVCNTYSHKNWDEIESLEYNCPFCHSKKNLEFIERVVIFKIDSKTKNQIEFIRNTYYEPRYYLM